MGRRLKAFYMIKRAEYEILRALYKIKEIDGLLWASPSEIYNFMLKYPKSFRKTRYFSTKKIGWWCGIMVGKGWMDKRKKREYYNPYARYRWVSSYTLTNKGYNILKKESERKGDGVI